MGMLQITRVVSELFNVPVNDVLQVKNLNRSDRLVMVRSMAMMLIKSMSSASLKQIVAFFHLKNHSTAINAIRQCGNMMETDSAFRGIYRRAVELFEYSEAERELYLGFYPFVYLDNIV